MIREIEVLELPDSRGEALLLDRLIAFNPIGRN